MQISLSILGNDHLVILIDSRMMLRIAFELHEWELNKLPFIRTATGRHIYICLFRVVFSHRHCGAMSIKGLLASDILTDRAIRLKLREMEEDGYIHCEVSGNDKRAVAVKPSDTLRACMLEHAMLFDQLIAKNYVVIDKNNE